MPRRNAVSEPRDPPHRTVAPNLALEIRLLGGFELRSQGATLTLATRKAEAVIALLALRPGQSFARDKLCGLLWPEVPEEQARQSLRQTLHGLRRALGSADAIVRADRRNLVLDPARVSVDVAIIELRLSLGSRASLVEAAAIYRGDLLDGVSIDEQPFQNWLTFERERLRGVMASGLGRLVELQTQAGELNDATQTCAQWLQLDPLREEAHRALMRLQARQGRRATALHHYRSLERSLRTEIGTAPDEQTRKLHSELEAGAAFDARGPATVLDTALQVRRVAANAPSVGRDAELSSLHGALAPARGTPGVCLLIGDAGVGKTHLCERFALERNERGSRVLQGRCFESEQVLPFSPWAKLLTDARLLEDSALLSSLPSALQRELACFLPELDDSEARKPGQDVLRLFRAIQGLLSRLAERGPLLLILEDLQWADEMSLRLLCFLARATVGTQGWFMLASARREEISTSPFMHNALDELEREQRLQKIELSPLSQQDSCQLASALAQSSELRALSRERLDQVWAISEGNPLVIVEVTRALAADALDASVAQLPVPERVRALIRRRVQRASAGAREVLSFGAVAGRELELGLLRSGSMAESELLAAVEELVEAQLVRAVSDRIYFTHDRIRETLYVELLPARRRWLHEQVAAALERHHAGRVHPVLGHIGYHWSKAGNADAAVSYLVRFAIHARRGHGVGEALSALNQALSDSPRLTARSAETAIEIVIEQAFCLAFLGRLTELVERLQEHLSQLEALNAPALAARFHFWWGFALMMMAKLREAEHQAERSLHYAARADDSRGMGYAHAVLAYVCGMTGQCERGTAHATAATELLDVFKDIPEARCLSWINLALNRTQLGDWRGALAAGEQAQAVGDAADSDRVRSLAASTIGYVYASSQQWELALDATRMALAICNDPFTLVQALTISAYNHAMSGRVQEAIAIAEPVIAQLELHGMHAFTCHALNVLAEARLRAGELARAREAASQAARWAQFASDRRALGIALRVEGRAAQLLGESLAAREHLVEALHVFESFGARIEIANTLLALSELAFAESDRELARSHLMRARSLYVECDVTRGVEDVDSLLATH